MGEYEVYVTEIFKKVYETLEKSEQEWIQNIKKKLEEYPAGKPLQFKWFREKKSQTRRLYFLVDWERKKILLVAFAPKKEQKEVINFILANREELFRYLGSL